MKDRFPSTVYRAIRRPDGRIVCVDPDYLQETSKRVEDVHDYIRAREQGWSDHPDDALRVKNAEEDQLSEDAAVRNYDDRRMSDAAKAEADAAVSDTIRHVADIPVAPKRGRGRPKKTAA